MTPVRLLAARIVAALVVGLGPAHHVNATLPEAVQLMGDAVARLYLQPLGIKSTNVRLQVESSEFNPGETVSTFHVAVSRVNPEEPTRRDEILVVSFAFVDDRVVEISASGSAVECGGGLHPIPSAAGNTSSSVDYLRKLMGFTSVAQVRGKSGELIRFPVGPTGRRSSPLDALFLYPCNGLVLGASYHTVH